VLFAGRHVADKRIRSLVEALVIARRSRPDLNAVIVGDGPERAAVLEDIDRLSLTDAVSAPGFVCREELDGLFGRATCLAYPSIRDGYGMVVAEAMAAGLPVVVCKAPDNAATELVEEGVNGAVAEDASPERLAAAILKVVDESGALRLTTAEWHAANAERLSIRRSIDRVHELYGRPSAAARDNGAAAKQDHEAGEVGGRGERPVRVAFSGTDARGPGPGPWPQAQAPRHDPVVELGVSEGVDE
jgi:glycosyltransferase involved in cell wall biosynthesis